MASSLQINTQPYQSNTGNAFFDHAPKELWVKILTLLCPHQICQSRRICKRLNQIVLEHRIFKNYSATLLTTHKMFHKFFSCKGLETHMQEMVVEQKNLLGLTNRLPVSKIQEPSEIDKIKTQTLSLIKDDKIDEALSVARALKFEEGVGVISSWVPLLSKNSEHFFKVFESTELKPLQVIYAKAFFESCLTEVSSEEFWPYLGTRAGLAVSKIKNNRFDEATQVFNALEKRFALFIGQSIRSRVILGMDTAEEAKKTRFDKKMGECFLASVFCEAGLVWKAAEHLKIVWDKGDEQPKEYELFFNFFFFSNQPPLFSRLMNVFTEHSAAIKQGIFIAHFKKEIEQFLQD